MPPTERIYQVWYLKACWKKSGKLRPTDTRTMPRHNIVTNQPSVSDWVIQVPLWPSGLGIGLWNRRPGFDPRTVRYTGGSGNPGSPVSGSPPPWLKVAWARGLGFQKGESNVTNQPSVSDWVVQVPLWPSGLGFGLWNRQPRFDPRTVHYNMTIFQMGA